MSSKVLHSLPTLSPTVRTTPKELEKVHPSLIGRSRIVKRLIDVVGGLAGLVLLAPVFVLVAIAIKLDSTGPVVFRQRRVGLNGREFDMYKFRSMYVDAEARKADLMAYNEILDGPIFKMKNDPRVTRVGRYLRRMSLDEFPQLVNVLLGHMSLVGPRPPLPSEVLRYDRDTWRRLSVIPGATGLWQVSGRSDITSFNKMLALDVRYIDNWSLSLDLRILIKTVRVILKAEGAC